MESLPKSVDYAEHMSVIPAGTENIHCTCYPVNGGGPFGPGQQIIVDLNNVGYLDPASISIRYKLNLSIPAIVAGAATSATGQSFSVAGCPVYSPFLRLDTLFNSNVVESINNYNSVATALSNMEWGVSDKMGMGSGFGYYEQVWATAAYGAGTVVIPTMDYSSVNESTDGLTIVAGTANAANATLATVASFSLSAPLPSLLSNAEKLVPLNGTNIRLQFTLDALGNVCPLAVTPVTPSTSSATLYNLNNVLMSAVQASLGSNPSCGQFTAYTITNFEVVYNQIQFAPHIERQILDMPKLRIKTSSYATGLQTLAVGSSGTANLVYNLRYASIKAMFLLMGGGTYAGQGTAAAPSALIGTGSANKLLESIDMTSGGGSYNFQVNGTYYPQNPLSTVNNKSGVLLELRRAMQDLYASNVSSMSIDVAEFGRTDAGVGVTATSITVPGKFYVGVHTSKMTTSAVFSGISSQNSPITAIVNLGSVATVVAYSPILLLYYDGIIEIDTMTKQVNYIY